MRDPKAIRKAIMTAKSIASLVDPKFSRVPLPDLGVAAPEVYVPEHSPAMHEAFDVPMPDKYASGGDVDDQHPYAEPDDLGLYSHAAATAAGLPQERGTPEQFRGMLLNKGVKPTELHWGEYDYAFGDKPEVSREDVARHMASTMPSIEEMILKKGHPRGARGDMVWRHQQEKRKLLHDYNSDWRDPEFSQRLDEMRARHAEEIKDIPHGDPYHHEYTIPGGKNYREILLKHGDEGMFPGVKAHFGGEPDILTSLRMKDREDTEGKKILHLDELQSDWAQQGRKGFKSSATNESLQALDDYLKELQEKSGRDVTQIWPHAAMQAAKDIGEEDKLDLLMDAAGRERRANEAMPKEAPYVTKTNDWVDLGLKRVLLEAARQGHDKLAWSPGDVHADRYDLSKHIGEIRHEKNDDGTFNLDIAGPEGHRIYDRDDIEPEELPAIVGKEMADKILSGHGEPDEHPGYRDWRTISGLDLKVGGEGMRKFYDELVPKRLIKLAKMHDPEAKITHSVIEHPLEHYYEENEGKTILPALEITPKMRESILKKGFPAYAQGGEVEGYADGGEIDPELFKQYMKRIHTPLSDDPESVRHALKIAGSYRSPIGMETGTGSLYNVKQSMPAKDVRATIGDIPGITMKKPVKKSWEDFYEKGKGGVFINMGGDLSNFGRLTHINDKELAWPVDLHAGTKFMLEPNPKYVWGNAAGHSTAFENKIRAAEEAGKDAYGIFSPMGPSAVNSSHNMFDALMAQIPNAGIDKKHLQEFDAALKRGDHLDANIKSNPKKLEAHLEALKAWPGLENAKEASEYARPEAGNLTGTHRTMIVKFMDKADWLKKGFPEVGVTRAAITDPELKGVGGNKIGHRVVKLSSEQLPGAKRAFEHSTYPTYTGGEYVMDVPLVQRHYAAPDVIEQMIRKPTKAGQIVHPYSEDTLGRATARKLFEEQKQMQPVNQRMLDSVMMGMENQEKYGFKKGGAVRKALMIAKGGKKK